MRRARERVHHSWKGVWRVALRAGVLESSRGVLHSGGEWWVLVEEAGIVDGLARAAVGLLGELNGWIWVVRAGRSLV